MAGPCLLSDGQSFSSGGGNTPGQSGGEQRLREYRWSSFGEYLKTPAGRPGWLRVDRVLGETGIVKDSTAGRRFEEVMEERRAEERSAQWKTVRRGWCLGEEPFRRELLEQVHEKAGTHHYGEEIGESVQEKARRIIAEELAKLNWEEAELGRRRKGDEGKVRIARRLRQETTVSKRWIANQLSMGTVSNVTLCLKRGRKR